MIWQTSRPAVRAMRRIRFCLLALVALFAAHDAVFLAEFGFGDTFAAVMRQTGHDAYWPAYMLLVGARGGAAGRERRVPHRAPSSAPRRARARGLVPPGHAPPGAGARQVLVADAPSYRPRAHRPLDPPPRRGPGGLRPPGERRARAPTATSPASACSRARRTRSPCRRLVVVTFLLAALGALVRWRIAVLRGPAPPRGDVRLARRRPAGPAARRGLVDRRDRRRTSLDHRPAGPGSRPAPGAPRRLSVPPGTTAT